MGEMKCFCDVTTLDESDWQPKYRRCSNSDMQWSPDPVFYRGLGLETAYDYESCNASTCMMCTLQLHKVVSKFLHNVTFHHSIVIHTLLF